MIPIAPSFFKRGLFLAPYDNKIMAYNTFRAKDMEAERELSKFLDKYLYTKEIFSKADRTDDVDLQMAGSDIIVSIPSLGIENAVVDEKASIYYINKDLRTFVLEISFLNKGYNLNEGWFIDDSLSTEYYLMQWIKANVDDPWKVKESNITEIECVLVSKQVLKEYFIKEGYDKANLLTIAQQLRDSNRKMIAPAGKPYRFFYTPTLAEKPVNILLDKEEYIRLGAFHFFIKPL